jgi:hypothetical protein
MAETHSIEKLGFAILVDHLHKTGRTFEKSKRKTFDLVVDGIPAELKCKQSPWGKLDFIGLTDKQRSALEDGEQFLLFVVCNLKGTSEPEIIEIASETLRSARFIVESTHYIYGSTLRHIMGNTNVEIASGGKI